MLEIPEKRICGTCRKWEADLRRDKLTWGQCSHNHLRPFVAFEEEGNLVDFKQALFPSTFNCINYEIGRPKSMWCIEEA